MCVRDIRAGVTSPVAQTARYVLGTVCLSHTGAASWPCATDRQVLGTDPVRQTDRQVLGTDHVHHLWVDGLCDDVPVVGDVLHHLAQRRPLHLLPFQVAQRVGQEVKEHATLSELLDEELLLLGGGDVYRGGREEIIITHRTQPVFLL